MPRKSTTTADKDAKKSTTAAKKTAATKSTKAKSTAKTTAKKTTAAAKKAPATKTTTAKKATATKTAAAKKTTTTKSTTTKKSTATTKKPAAKKAAAPKKVATTKKAPATKTTTAKKASTAKTTTKKATAPKKSAVVKEPPTTKKPTSSKAKAEKPVVKPEETKPRKAAAAMSRPKPVKKEDEVTEAMVLVEQTPIEDLPAIPIVYGDIVIDPYPIDPKEEYMGTKHKEHFIEILHAWKKALMEEVDRTMSLMQAEVKNLPDITDRASQDEEFSVALRTRDRERKLIKKIDSTLVRIRKDDYGYCDSCGIEIGVRRLEARPTANLCIDCKTLDEIVEKQTRG